MANVIFLSPHSDPEADLGEVDAGGQCVYEHELALALAKNTDIQVTTFCRQTHRRPAVSKVTDGYTIRRIECGEKEFIPKEQMGHVLFDFSREVYRQISGEKASILYGHYWDGGKAALHVKALGMRQTPLVWTPHSLGAIKRQKFKGKGNEFFYNFIPRLVWENYSIFMSDLIIASTLKEKHQIMDYYALAEDRVAVIPPGVDLKRLEKVDQKKARQALDLPQKGKIVLSLGRMSPTKGYEHALEMFAPLKKLYKGKLTLVILGGGAEPSREEKAYLNRLKALAKRLKISASVIFRPAVGYERVNLAYSAADIFLMLSENEPFGLTMIEAMAMGLPTIATHTGGATHLIIHNISGILADVNRPSQVAHYALALLKDRSYYETISTAAERFVSREFSWKRKAGLFAEQFHTLLEDKASDKFDNWIDNNAFLKFNLLQ